MNEPVRFVRFPELASRFGIDYTRQYIHRLEKAGRFPCRVRLGINRMAWIESEIAAWQQAKIGARVSRTLAAAASEPADPTLSH